MLLCKQQFGQLNTCLINNDSRGVAQIMRKYLAIIDVTEPLFNDKKYVKACNRDSSVRNDTIMLDQSLCMKNGDNNVTLLQKMNDYLKPLANRLYHIPDTY